jgi:hypothetical protein
MKAGDAAHANIQAGECPEVIVTHLETTDWIDGPVTVRVILRPIGRAVPDVVAP